MPSLGILGKNEIPNIDFDGGVNVLKIIGV